MASSSEHGVAAVTLPKFSSSGDPRRNYEKFIQLFKDLCELNGWYDSEPLPSPIEEGGEPPPTRPVWLAKGKAMGAFRSAKLVTKNSKASCKAFNCQRKNGRNRRLFSNIWRNISRQMKEYWRREPNLPKWNKNLMNKSRDGKEELKNKVGG